MKTKHSSEDIQYVISMSAVCIIGLLWTLQPVGGALTNQHQNQSRTSSVIVKEAESAMLHITTAYC